MSAISAEKPRTPADAVAQFRVRAEDARTRQLHHDQRRAYLVDLLREGFGIQTDEVELERDVRLTRTRGRIDLLYRDIVFEVKRDLAREHDDIVRELTLYQIDLARGTRVFFGFRPTQVPRNTLLGSVIIEYGRHRVDRHMRFGNNHMDKLDLPIPDEEGPPSYAATTLLFTRIAPGRFRLTVGTARQNAAWRRRSAKEGASFAMQSGRQ